MVSVVPLAGRAWQRWSNTTAAGPAEGQGRLPAQLRKPWLLEDGQTDSTTLLGILQRAQGAWRHFI